MFVQVMDTCWNRCPDYDDMCDYQYPTWPKVNTASLTGTDHTPIRPNLTSPGNAMCSSDPEYLYSSGRTQCTTEEITFRVSFDTDGHGDYSINPSSLQEYNRYHVGGRWNAEYNNAGQFHMISSLQ